MNHNSFGGCGHCPCYDCLFWWSHRCPYGTCYDDYRAQHTPYPEYHPGEPPRTQWSYWKNPGEQNHWCRGGAFYTMDPEDCSHYVKYEGQAVKTCLKANVSIFQDGYIDCSLILNYGCEKCYEEWEEQQDTD